jgi:hypothetical protein
MSFKILLGCQKKNEKSKVENIPTQRKDRQLAEDPGDP